MSSITNYQNDINEIISKLKTKFPDSLLIYVTHHVNYEDTNYFYTSLEKCKDKINELRETLDDCDENWSIIILVEGQQFDADIDKIWYE